ncbi:phage tail sheath C-terminal domain-containing protein [Halobacteriovorax sp. GB3]|uniref:phage tail sheath subtilisin-like domain-containing protein n=1 Tax=Halobacteriovorax sp. GB3 TaxID=2719615 RepID=UPI0023621274|nr:phage tail sheath subtilisin-like domain-containing protein [Halobacteriovorax sp. GB3]MDD0852994.1 phage tail sheath C-terminal domain-containing protein [Halobacteriovorax sp. GB3]
MSIGFNEIPNQLAPWAFLEFDNSGAGADGDLQYKALIVGQRLTNEGTHNSLTKERVNSADQVAKMYGYGSMIHAMVDGFRKNDRQTELYVIALDDLDAGVKAVKTVTFSAQSVKAGVIQALVGGVKIVSAATTDATGAEIATAFANAVNAEKLCPFEAVATDAAVALTAKHKGEIFNELEISFNHYYGEVFPEGVSVAIADTVNGAGNPDVQDAINKMGDDQFNIAIFPYTDTANLIAVEAELSSRFGPTKQTEGSNFCVKNATHGNLGTLGDSRNSQLNTIMNGYKVPTPPYVFAAQLAGVVSKYGQIDPARPFQTLEIVGTIPPKQEHQFIREERSILLGDGISTFMVSPGGKVLVERLVTTYNVGAFGQQDLSYQNLNTILTLSFVRWSLRTRLLNKYPRHKLADDGTKFGTGQPIVTPKVIKGELVALFREWEDAGLVENIDQFLEDIIVERNSSNRDRIDFRINPDLINQMRIFGGQIQFIL